MSESFDLLVLFPSDFFDSAVYDAFDSLFLMYYFLKLPYLKFQLILLLLEISLSLRKLPLQIVLVLYSF